MKRIVSIIILVLYIIPVIGINLSLHYCGGKITSVSFNAKNKGSCSCKSQVMKKGCCQNKEISIKQTSDQDKAPECYLSQVNLIHFLDYLSSAFSFLYFQPSFISNQLYCSHHPPDNVKHTLYIINQNFRI
jgi:hypothetical protein